MAARAYWQGQIRLALVSIPVEIYAATKSGAQISFHQIHEPSGKRVRYEKTVPGLGPVKPEDIVKGFEVSKGDYVLLQPEEIEAVKLESKKTLELTQFVDADEIDVLYYERPYYVVPADDLAEEAFVVLREALRRAKKVGLGQLAMRGREYIVSLKPCGRGMVLETLRYADEVNRAQSYFREIEDVKPDPELLDLAEALIEKKTAPFKPDSFHDRYVDALERLIEKKKKAKGRRIIEDEGDAPVKRSGNVIDLMAALKKSVDSGQKTPARNAAKKPAARRATPSKAPARKRA
ncbi:putative DNA repair protein [Sphingobium herbicidovorans NBRC 16415]|jgi:DNA end-binding protein Ku|uniref:Non-homologous end joining protein Ku n=1 Tax=Sphingobium herbicidovorans (strain ATCC 700291 / DSM 11019 / CCUG 56400 / KCTC 2939 / LMG 18315 / NBRC 16415 / MH) TaxID=1219045 RepID=A0A086PCJ2_SPHHM|nr:Ku protein [Sphingobium herbicidovorans]KFG91110.1 putative DNA repair protein [Sphingobium herbicidovorans NBRC 16415]